MVLVITHPTPIPDETLIWKDLLDAGADALLLRRPHWDAAACSQALEQLDPACYQRTLVAQHWELYQRFGLMGVHLSEILRNSTPVPELDNWRGKGCLLSTGIRDAAALPQAKAPWDFLLLSPVFDSISKPGYKGRFRDGFQLQRKGCQAKVLALGGVDRHNAAQARQMGFDGIALLGAIWQHPAKAAEQLHTIRKQWNMNAHT